MEVSYFGRVKIAFYIYSKLSESKNGSKSFEKYFSYFLECTKQKLFEKYSKLKVILENYIWYVIKVQAFSHLNESIANNLYRYQKVIGKQSHNWKFCMSALNSIKIAANIND